MRAATFDGATSRVSIETLPIPRPGPDDLLIKVRRCGVCGTDVAMTSDGPFKFGSGQFGHEYSGEVIEVGRNVRTHVVGDRIAALPVIGCGRCRGCREGNPLLCRNQATGMFGFGEYAVIPPKVAIRLPDSLSFADGALVEPMACGLHAMRLARVEPGARVLVMGAGSMALAAIYWARQLGAGRIVVLSRSAHRRDLAMSMGADAVVGFDPDARARLSEMFGGESPDIVADCVGKPGMIALAADHVRPGGTILEVGMCMTPEPIVPARFTFGEIRLLFPMGYTTEEFTATARAFDAGRLHPESMVSDVITLEDLPVRLETLRKSAGGNLKVHVDLTRRAS
ncbi:MAG TPA: zinc-binding dehydrogenase [Steroidobacteraceae bacterium]|nr:zinc-binding dehydrogenase [Steroidobacteraceae bacterium]